MSWTEARAAIHSFATWPLAHGMAAYSVAYWAVVGALVWATPNVEALEGVWVWLALLGALFHTYGYFEAQRDLAALGRLPEGADPIAVEDFRNAVRREQTRVVAKLFAALAGALAMLNMPRVDAQSSLIGAAAQIFIIGMLSANIWDGFRDRWSRRKVLRMLAQRRRDTATPSRSSMRRFYLRRDVDETGISGTGIVAEGVVFSNGWVSLTWLTATTSVVWYPGIEAVERIHGHNGKTKVLFIDSEEAPYGE